MRVIQQPPLSQQVVALKLCASVLAVQARRLVQAAAVSCAALAVETAMQVPRCIHLLGAAQEPGGLFAAIRFRRVDDVRVRGSKAQLLELDGGWDGLVANRCCSGTMTREPRAPLDEMRS
jgi:hypothetical protein